MRKFINKILNVPKLILRLWIILWVCLVILLVLKFCFGMWYPIVSNNETFNNICKFVDDNIIVYKILSLVLYVFSFNIIFLTATCKMKYDNWIWCLSINILAILVGILKINVSLAGNILEIVCIISYIIINFICKNFDKKWKNIVLPLFAYAFINLWQLSIYLVRGLNLEELNTYPFLIGIILMIDYYIAITINWIGVNYMGWFSMGWLFSKDVTTLKAEKEKELAKEQPDMKKVAEIDEHIKELESENK